ncbi:hypothetical protein DYB25_001394 [Aphanomyces astaci]|uniref:Kinesin motor domain-containing protein n=2 Tax=Aphanomyces astaci TaxID=112090 RepID=A0A397EMV2_APHAT|nr:hypothetical protein DYB25_001394 [Aphanomyces astaci]RHY49525.1 hypothetical protein DYB30_007731 [Aphanomyces astaci]RHY84519.1 hypothetical protein DYB31_001334 [Aphanomyces astaci]
MDDELAAVRRELDEVKEDLLLKSDEYNELVTASSVIEAELEKDLQEVEQKAEKWRQQAQRFEDEVRDAREKMATHFRDSATLQRELDRTKEKLQTLTQDRARWETEVDHLTTQVRILEASNEDLKHQLERAQEDKVFLQHDYAEIEKEHELSSERYRSEILDLKSELFAVKVQVSAPLPRSTDVSDFSFRDSLSALIEDNPFRPSMSLERDMEENEKHIQILQDELRELGNRLQDEEDRRGHLEAQLVEMQDRQAHMEAMEAEINDMSDELIEKAEHVKRAENEVTCLQTNLTFTLASVEAMLSSTKEQHEMELDALRLELDASRSLASSQESSYHELSVLRAEYSQLEALHAQAKVQLDMERAKFAQLSAELDQSKGATEAVQEELDELRQQYDDLQSEHSASFLQLRSQSTPPPVTRPARSQSMDAHDVAQKYLLERKRNAMLLSKLQNVTGNMQVLCRVRPLLAHDPAHKGPEVAVDVLNLTDVAAMEMKADHVDVDAPWKVFTFDRVLSPHCTQTEVFREVEPMAQAVIDGFKACIFAYGQTGSGKTYTMEGTPSHPGLNYRLLSHMFESVALRGSVVDRPEAVASFDVASDRPVYHLQLGVFEIYNDTIRDLLKTNNVLDIRTDEFGDVGVPALHMETIFHPTHALEVLSQAQKNRASCATNVHGNSSRSHSVVLVQMKSNAGQRGTLYLVDLAGSERVKVSGDHALKETAAINKSLSALGDVMEALDKKQAHVPYRNSKLTYALQDVLGSSQCKTVMILNVAPGFTTASETYRSMQFAERARRIVVAPHGIKPRQRGLLTGKQAFTEIKSLKSQVAAANAKLMQVNQTIVTMVPLVFSRRHKLTTLLEQKTKAADEAKSAVQTMRAAQSDLQDKLKQERELRQQEVAHADQELKQRRQLQSKTKVSAAHKESLEKLLFERESEVLKLRQSLNDARRRSQNSLIPRLSLEAASTTTTTPLDTFKRMTVEDPVSSSSASETELESESSTDKPVPSRIPQRVLRRTTFPQSNDDPRHMEDDAPSKRKAVSALRVPVAIAAIEGALRKPVTRYTKVSFTLVLYIYTTTHTRSTGSSNVESRSKIPRRAFGTTKNAPREDNQATNKPPPPPASSSPAYRRMWK